MRYTATVNGTRYDVTAESPDSPLPSFGPQAQGEPAKPAMLPPMGVDVLVASPTTGMVGELNLRIGDTAWGGQTMAVVQGPGGSVNVASPHLATVKQVLVNKGTLVSTGDILFVLHQGQK